MRTCITIGWSWTFVLVACGSNGGQTIAPDAPEAAERGFAITSPEVDIQPGQEITYCYYFRTPNTELLGIKRWKSQMTPGSHHMILFTTGTTDEMPPGTISASGCGGSNAIPVWTYSAQTPTADLVLPTDDGAGMPLGMDIPPNTAAYLQMHYLNTTDQPLKAHVRLDAEAHAAGVAYTRTAAYVTFNASITIPPMSTNVKATMTCPVPATTKFWMMSTHAHKQAIHTEVRDGTAVTFASSDWEHPGSTAFEAPTFYRFGSNSLTYECVYDNPTNRTIHTGNSAATDEMCMASGYFFPAAEPKFCLNDTPIN